MHKPDDQMEGWKAIQREQARKQIVERQRVETARKAEEAMRRLSETLFGKK